VHGQNAKSVNHHKYLGIVLTTEFLDDKDIQRQLQYQYCAANKLRASFSRCSHAVKNLFFRSFCTPTYALQLWCNFRKPCMQRLRVAYNFGCRTVHNLPWRASVSIHTQNRRQKTSIGRLYVCARKLGIENFIKTPLISSDSYFNLLGLSPPIPRRVYEGEVQEVHCTRTRQVLGPGRLKVRALSFSVIKAKITSVSQLPV